MKLLAKLKLDQGLALVIGTKLLFAVGAAVTFYPMLRLAHVMGGAAASLLLGIAAIAFPASLLYSSRALAEVACAPLITWSLWILWPCGSLRARVGPTPNSAWCRRASGSCWEPVFVRLGDGAPLSKLGAARSTGSDRAGQCGLRAAIALAAGELRGFDPRRPLDSVTWASRSSQSSSTCAST